MLEGEVVFFSLELRTAWLEIGERLDTIFAPRVPHPSLSTIGAPIAEFNPEVGVTTSHGCW